MHAVKASPWRGLVLPVVAAVAAIGWLVIRTLQITGTEPAPAVELEKPRSRQAAPVPAPIRYPIGAAHGEGYPYGPAPLPPLDASDDAARTALGVVFGARLLDRFFNMDGFARRVVSTIDNLPRAEVGSRAMVLRPVPGIPVVAGAGDSLVLDERNEARYDPYLELLWSVEPSRLVGVYLHFYPLLQQAYRELGYPNGHFNDRVIEVIDDMLATPDVAAPVHLSQPRVLYEFADPRLEVLSAGQKAMIRIGPSNAALAKQRLREVREHLAPLSR